MRVAFYAPLKAPDHPVPSGDRRMARALVALLERQGHEVRLVSRFRSFDRDGHAWRQMRLRTIGARIADRLGRRLDREPRPELWLTYHCHHKAPDWLGPMISQRLAIPYAIAEPSVAGKQADGPWAIGFAGALQAIRTADVLLPVTAVDAEGVVAALRAPANVRGLPPFLDATPFAAAADGRAGHRAGLAARHGLDPARPWLLTVAMMRADVKRESYLALADALAAVRDRPWQLLVVGDGEARGEIEARFAALGEGRVRFAGALGEDALPACYAAADLYVWPAFREAYGLAMLEAQAAGLPVLAYAEGGVAEVVADGETGILVPGRRLDGFVAVLRHLLDDAGTRTAFATAARARVLADHDLPAAAARLDRALALAADVHARRRRAA